MWKVGASKSTLVARAEGSPAVAIAPDAKGRLWVAWSEGTFGDKRILAARSNPEATRLGAPVDAGVAKGTHSVYALDASATTTSLDVLALFGTGNVSGGATYVTRVLPGLTLKARRSGGRTTFTVTDAGDPVKRATVKAGGRSAKTDAKGRATIAVRKGTATASASGYEPAKLKLK